MEGAVIFWERVGVGCYTVGLADSRRVKQFSAIGKTLSLKTDLTEEAHSIPEY